jgi:hypothetical protein
MHIMCVYVIHVQTYDVHSAQIYMHDPLSDLRLNHELRMCKFDTPPSIGSRCICSPASPLDGGCIYIPIGLSIGLSIHLSAI